MNETFSLENIKTLCFMIDNDYDNLLGEGKNGKIRELILRIRSQITFDKETHPQGLPVYQCPKLKTGKP
ncbi:hypothetical protein MNBD_CHLOROFLEXI01-4223 [hydrothermal vent metagenome]|uniref:Uncharacterized protein n=1 Tax=hydrothermal vent metagenome TaxID=652676 RepID=A0A3B0UL80_9ZZZZ